MVKRPPPYIQVRQVKPGNIPHLSWQAAYIAENGEWLAVLAKPGITVQHHTRKLAYVLPHYCLSLFSNRAYYNVMLDFHPTGECKQVYINVAEPATWENNTIQALDLDLDVVVSPDGRPTLLDEDEFADSIAAGRYDAQTIATARQTARHLMAVAGEGAFPFLRGTVQNALATVRHHLGNR